MGILVSLADWMTRHPNLATWTVGLLVIGAGVAGFTYEWRKR